MSSPHHNKLTFHRESKVVFIDRYSHVPVFHVSGGVGDFDAFVYQCRLNLDIDGAPTTYGLDNPDNDEQSDLHPLENYKPTLRWITKDKRGHQHVHIKKLTEMERQKIGLANAAGSPGNGELGHQNFQRGNRRFYWAGVKSLTRSQADRSGMTIDDRPELEAGLRGYVKKGRPIVLAPVGEGYFPVLQTDSGPSAGPAPGYYFSTTSAHTDGDNSLDATVVPYAVWANNWAHTSGKHRVTIGDVGLAIVNNTGNASPFLYGDSGTQNKVGECSQKLQDALGGGDDPGLVTFIAFPKSGHGSMVGLNPEANIPFTVQLKLDRLADNASHLARHIVHAKDGNGTDGMTADQTGRYEIIMKALDQWTVLKNKTD